MYQALLGNEFAVFTRLADELATEIVGSEVECLAGDAAEGYNPAHDVCRALVGAAAAMAGSSMRRDLVSFDFPLTGRPEDGGDGRRGLRLRLDEPTFQEKIAAARRYVEMKADVEESLSVNGLESFRVECLYAADRPDDLRKSQPMPFYEEHGRARVAQGHYSRLITYRDHVAPVEQALIRHVEHRTR
jgi:hypothetical protein